MGVSRSTSTARSVSRAGCGAGSPSPFAAGASKSPSCGARAFMRGRSDDGDPVGSEAAIPGLLNQLQAFAQTRGLKLGAVGASERLRPLYEHLGLRTIYLGDETIIDLDRGDRIVMLTDGVVEAQSRSGELVGFERTLKISSKSAEKIATAAQHFGKEDDITVLTLTFSPAPDLVEAIHA